LQGRLGGIHISLARLHHSQRRHYRARLGNGHAQACSGQARGPGHCQEERASPRSGCERDGRRVFVRIDQAAQHGLQSDLRSMSTGDAHR
jgi:hypothetical protein